MKIVVVKVISISFISVLALFFFYWSSFPLVDVFNIYPFNFPREKREPSFLCKLDNELTIRAYHGNGSHATTSDSDGVYVQFSSQPFERVIWSAYSSPLIDKISCEDEILFIVTKSDNPVVGSFRITPSEIKDNLVSKPVRFEYGKSIDTGLINRTDLSCLSSTLLPGSLCLWAVIWILKKKSTE